MPRPALPLAAACLALVAADWPQFRGPDANGIAPTSAGAAKPAPASFAAEDVKWAVALPGAGWSQPIVSGDTIFVQTAVSDPPLIPKGFMGGIASPMSRGGAKDVAPKLNVEWKLLALELGTGATKWERTVTSGQPKYGIHPSNTYATETAAASGTTVVSYFGATGTACAFDFAGKELWKVELGAGPTANGFGTGSSPLIHAGKVYIQQHNESIAALTCLELGTGRQVWQVKREKPSTSWASPVAWVQEQGTQIVCCGRGLVTGHDPDTGNEVWRVGGLDSSFSSTPAVSPAMLYFGSSGPGTVAPLYALKAGAKGDCSLADGATSNEYVAWMRKGAGPGMASPVALGDKLYVLSNSGLKCFDGATGEVVYSERIPKSRTTAASPFVVSDRMTVVDESGLVSTVKLGAAFEVLGSGQLTDTVWATPTPIDGGMLVRGVEKLYRVGK